MHPSASPRHPWKALAVLIAMFGVVHGLWPGDVSGAGWRHVHVFPASSDGPDDPDIHIHLPEGGPDDGTVVDVFDGDDWR